MPPSFFILNPFLKATQFETIVQVEPLEQGQSAVDTSKVGQYMWPEEAVKIFSRALCHATEKGNTEEARELLSYGALVNNSEGIIHWDPVKEFFCSPLHIAIFFIKSKK